MSTYEPREDSYLLAGAVKNYAFGKVLDVGTGSGIQAATALKNKRVASVIATDVDKNCVANIKNRKIRFIHSDLFERIPKQKFDTIIFNPPYLPQDKGIKDVTLYGGKKGYEIIERFLRGCKEYLSNNGFVLLLFSSFSNRNKINEIIAENVLEQEEVSRQQLPMFETLYVYKIKKSWLLQKLEKLKVINIEKFATGKRGIIYVGELNNKKVAVKAKNPDSLAKNTIENEIKWLKVLNKKGIGPKLIRSDKDYFVAEFVEGEFILDFVGKSSKKAIVAVIKDVLQQCRTMDKLNIDKKEMGRPHKHVIVGKKTVMIDFERCRKTKRPKNVTQFCQFLIGKYFSELLKKKNIRLSREKILLNAKNYKNSLKDKEFNKILGML